MSRIHVVDDEPRILRFVSTSLRIAGYEVIECTSGAKALSLAESEKPDAMLLDLVMSPVDGFQVLARLRSFSTMPVIVSSARMDYGDKAISEGATSYLAKPFVPEMLVERIRLALGPTKPI